MKPIQHLYPEGEHISDAIRAAGWYELELLQELDNWLRLQPNGLILDVGANIGNHAAYWGQQGHRVKAFEPHPGNFHLLFQNTEGLEVECIPLAVGFTEQRVEQVGNDPTHNMGTVVYVGATSTDIATTVDMVRLDDVVTEPVMLIKIDVEGPELQVLGGAERILKEHKPLIVVEAKDPASMGRIATYLSRLGYQYVEDLTPWNPTHLFRHEDN